MTVCERSVQKDFIHCLNFACEAHRDQKRKDPEKSPYINHPIGVAYILSEEAGVANLDLLRGCLLHDTVEDTPVTIGTITAEFGTYIGNLVQEVTDDKSLPKQKRKDLQIVHAKTSSPQAKMVKLADKLYNLRDLERCLPEGWTEGRRAEYYAWASQVCQGLRGVCPPLDAQLTVLFTRHGLTSTREPSASAATAELPGWQNHDELRPLLAAADCAARRHHSQFVFDVPGGAPYINHVVSTAFIVSEDCAIPDVPVLCAALLKDVVGKTDCTREEINTSFGADVGHLVSEITYDHTLSTAEQFEYLVRKADTWSLHAKMITLAAMLDGCRRLAAWPTDTPSPSPSHRQEYRRGVTLLAARLSGTHPHLEQQLSLACAQQPSG